MQQCNVFLGGNLLDFIRILCIEELYLFAEVSLNVLTYEHRLFGIDEINSDTVFAEATLKLIIRFIQRKCDVLRKY